MAIDGLTKEQTQEYNKYEKMRLFFSDNAAKVNTYVPLKDQVTAFNTNITDVETLAPKKTTVTTGITDDKDQKKIEAADYWYGICAKARAFAIATGRADMAANMKRSRNDLFHLRDADLQPFCKQINDSLTPLLADPAFIPYGINAAALTSGMTLANDFKAMIGKTKDANVGKTVAAGDIDKEFGELRANNVMFRLLMEHFKTSDPDFYAGFIAIDVEDDIGIRHSGIEGNITNKSDGSANRDAQVKNLQNGKIAKPDLTGFYSMIKQRPGTYEFEVTAPGKKTITKIIKIRRGRIDDVDFEMENA